MEAMSGERDDIRSLIRCKGIDTISNTFLTRSLFFVYSDRQALCWFNLDSFGSTDDIMPRDDGVTAVICFVTMHQTLCVEPQRHSGNCMQITGNPSI